MMDVVDSCLRSVYIVFCKLYIFFQAKEILKKKVLLILSPTDQKTKVGLWKRNMKKKNLFSLMK